AVRPGRGARSEGTDASAGERAADLRIRAAEGGGRREGLRAALRRAPPHVPRLPGAARPAAEDRALLPALPRARGPARQGPAQVALHARRGGLGRRLLRPRSTPRVSPVLRSAT